jgi:hypothetical protein
MEEFLEVDLVDPSPGLQELLEVNQLPCLVTGLLDLEIVLVVANCFTRASIDYPSSELFST